MYRAIPDIFFVLASHRSIERKSSETVQMSLVHFCLALREEDIYIYNNEKTGMFCESQNLSELRNRIVILSVFVSAVHIF